MLFRPIFHTFGTSLLLSYFLAFGHTESISSFIFSLDVRERLAIFLCQNNYNGGKLAYKIFPHPRNNKIGVYLASLYADRVWDEMTSAEQERLWMQALLLEKKFFGESHRFTLRSKLALSELYYKVGRIPEAKLWLANALNNPCDGEFDHNEFYAYGQATWFYHDEKNVEKQIYYHKLKRKFLRSCSHFGTDAWKGQDATIVRLLKESNRRDEAIKYEKEHSQDSQPAEFHCNKSNGLVIDRLIDRSTTNESWFKLLDQTASCELQKEIDASCILKNDKLAGEP